MTAKRMVGEEVKLAVAVPLRATWPPSGKQVWLDSTRLLKIILAYMMFARVEPACLGLCLNADPCRVLIVTKQTQPQKCLILWIRTQLSWMATMSDTNGWSVFCPLRPFQRSLVPNKLGDEKVALAAFPSLLWAGHYTCLFFVPSHRTIRRSGLYKLEMLLAIVGPPNFVEWNAPWLLTPADWLSEMHLESFSESSEGKGNNRSAMYMLQTWSEHSFQNLASVTHGHGTVREKVRIHAPLVVVWLCWRPKEGSLRTCTSEVKVNEMPRRGWRNYVDACPPTRVRKCRPPIFRWAKSQGKKSVTDFLVCLNTDQ